MIKILYLEDDLNLSETITDFLEENLFEVTVIYSADKLFSTLYEQNFDLLILDVNLPDGNGFNLLKELRKKDINIPAIFTTSLNSIEDLDIGFSSGADDYLRKPFALKELLLRINVLVKRQYSTYSETIKICDFVEYSLNSNELFVENKKVNLNNKESKLLKILVQNRNIELPFETIYETIWEFSEIPSETSLRTYIKNLRKLIGKDKIISIKKVGYKLVV